MERVREHFQSAAATDWNLYFSLFDEECDISVYSCATQLGLPKTTHCCLLTALHHSEQNLPMISAPTSTNDFTRISFRTGARKETVLLCFDAIPNPSELPAAAQLPSINVGASQIAPIDSNSYELYRQAEIAMLTSIVQSRGLKTYYKAETNPYGDLNTLRSQFMLAKSVLYILRQLVKYAPYGIVRVQIGNAGSTMPNAFDERYISLGHNRRVIFRVCKAPQHDAVDTQPSPQQFGIATRQIANGMDVHVHQLACGGTSDIEQFGNWQRPNLFLIVRTADGCDRIGLLDTLNMIHTPPNP